METVSRVSSSQVISRDLCDWSQVSGNRRRVSSRILTDFAQDFIPLCLQGNTSLPLWCSIDLTAERFVSLFFVDTSLRPVLELATMLPREKDVVGQGGKKILFPVNFPFFFLTPLIFLNMK